MKRKKYILLLLFLGLIPFSCFRKAEYPYYVINNMSIESYKDINLNRIINSMDSIENDSVFIKVNLGISYIAQHKNIGFENKCCAMKKPYNGMNGLKDKIESIYFTSNSIYNGQPAGTNLYFLLKTVFDKHIFNDNFKDYLNIGNSSRYPKTNDYIILYLSQRPTDYLKHNFTLKFVYKSGDSISANTSIMWK